jgi:hypothetical protein
MKISFKWFLCSFITTILSGLLCDIKPDYKLEIFYFLFTPSIVMVGISTFAIVVNAIHTDK